MSKILLAFYGDDFTGSTDALEFICKAGAKAMLFIAPPTVEQLKNYPDLDAYGVAGITRSLPPDEMEKILLPAFKKIKATGVAQVHYKVCSTFDSSVTVGSIGKAIDCGATVFKNKIIPVLGGTPALGRYCVFGNLFAKMGTCLPDRQVGSDGEIFRIDKHPSMSKHPVTPMDESDLRLHLGKQTNKKIGLVNWLHQKNSFSYWEYIYGDNEVVLLDTLTEGQLYKIGKWLIAQKQDEKPLFTVGSSAVEMALGKYWNDKKILSKKVIKQSYGNAKPLLVVSGSCSPVTKKQIEVAIENGFTEIIIDASKIANGKNVEENIQLEINDLLVKNKNVIVHTGNKKVKNLSSEQLGISLGNIVKEAVLKSKVKRVIVCGGDTSSYAARAMEIEAVEMIASLVTGAPLCKVHSKNKNIDGLEVNFKGGQVGGENYFGLF
jgi:3-oxoisoapionate kinase